MSLTKNIIIVVGVFGVGKTRYVDNYIKANPEYELINPASPDEVMAYDSVERTEYVIMDQYRFYLDWNAEKLKNEFDCPVEILVLFDRPELITYQQINRKDTHGIIDCNYSRFWYTDELRKMVYMPSCKYLDRDMKEHTYDEFRETYHSYWAFPAKSDVEDYINMIMKIDGYDKLYQNVSLPHGIKLGHGNNSHNEKTWEIIKSWFDWREKRVLELCCNHAQFSQQIWLHGGLPVGCDAHPEFVRSASVFAKMNGAKFDIHHCNVDERFPVYDFDIVMLFNALHWLKKQDDVLRRMVQFPISLFEINKEQKTQICNYFKVLKEVPSPKSGRILLKCEPK